MFVADVISVPLESHRDGMSVSEYAVPTGLSGHGGFGFYKYAAPTELKTDARSSPFKTFRSTDSSKKRCLSRLNATVPRGVVMR
ncbi:hypothetical protein QUF90_00140 [Desulfococcaceae bacterium HSG9]|nr:hypothetical protein [Desulfococcaceae bacterium HSG9]